MVNMRLLAEIKNPEFLIDQMYEQGTTFIAEVPLAGEGEEAKVGFEVLYFSANKCLHFIGSLTTEQLEKIRSQAQKLTLRTIEMVGFSGGISA